MAKTLITLRLELETLNVIDSIADTTGETRSAVAERALRVGVAQVDEAGKILKSPILGKALLAMIEFSADEDAKQRARAWATSGKKSTARVAKA